MDNSYKDIELENFKNLIQKQFSPNIYVAASENGRQICHSNLLTPAEVLRPFGYLQEATMRYRSSDKDRVISMTNFHMNFLDAEEFDQPKKE